MGSNSSKDHGFQPSSSNGYGTTTSASTSRYSHYAGHSVQHGDKNIRQKRYARIDDDYTSLEQVTDALAQAGLESSNLIVGVDFTKSNEWTGRVSFNRRSLHDIGQTPNPYEQAISIIGRSLSAFDEDNLIPCFGFGDASTHDRDVFSFYEDNRPCNGFEEALERYRELVPKLRLSGPTSFAPMIETAISIVDNSGGQYHVLLIIADGQVTRNVDITSRSLSSQEKDTINAIVKASAYPLSIVLVGVGDGPWDMMRQFDDNIPFRAFDNFQFVNFTEIMCKNIPTSKKETEFALAALMEIPSQYKATLDLQLLGQRKGIPVRRCLSPPIRGFEASSSTSNYARFGGQKDPSSPERFHQESKMCPMCSTKRKDLAFGCGHQTCNNCGKNLQYCPVCQSYISARIPLF